MTFEELVGSRLIFGIPGTTVTPDVIQHFKETHCSGLILYRINFQSPDQLRKLITDLETAVGRRLLVTTDQEGGRVIMFREGVTIFPSAQAFGRTGNTQFARRQGEQEGRELRRLGVDVNFAPVLDVLTPTFSPNIGIRAFGSDPDLVAKMGAARISAMQVEGVSACAKHFPGLGPANRDPHLNLPSISITWEELDRVHIVPFMRAMRTAVHSMMTSHPLYPNLDSRRNMPATFSRPIVHDYLRKKFGYKGVIFTDDMEMGAITELCPIGEAAVLAAEAGHDMILSCHDMASQRKVYDALVEAYRTKRLPTKELEESVQRVTLLREKRMERFGAPLATALRADKEQADAKALVHEICSASATTLRQGPALVPGASTAVLFPKVSEMSSHIMIEKEMLDETALLKGLLSSITKDPMVVLRGMQPSPADLEAASTAAANADQTILFVFDAHLQPTEQTLLTQIQERAKRLAVVLLRDVYDEEFVKPGTLCLTNYGFRVCDLQAVAPLLLSPNAVVTTP